MIARHDHPQPSPWYREDGAAGGVGPVGGATTLRRLALACILGLAAGTAEASQTADAAKLVEMFANPEIFDESSGLYTLVLDGCDAKLDNGWLNYRFLLSSVDFVRWEEDEISAALVLNEDAQRQSDAYHLQGGVWKLPWSPIGFQDLIQSDGSTEVEKRKLVRHRLASVEYFDKLVGGMFGEWFRQHHAFTMDAGYPSEFEPPDHVRMYILPGKKQTVISALASYTLKFCLPAPDFSCTPFFVDAPGTVC